MLRRIVSLRGASGSALLGCLIAAVVVAASASSAFAGGCHVIGFRNRAIGGVSISPEGVVAEATVDDELGLRGALAEEVRRPGADLVSPVGMRMVSLAKLEQALADTLKKGDGPLPEEIRFLAGLQRIQYVFIYPDKNDIVLAGPGEGWKISESGEVVGITTGRPVIHLEDLLVAFKTVNNANRGDGITCSIDPTEEGRTNFQQAIRQLRTFDPRAMPMLEKAMGPQEVTLTGVPTDSHFARVMVAADYRMKRLAMNLERSKVKEVPGFIEMLQARRAKPKNAMPRWWLTTSYDALARSEDGMAYELRGQGVKCMTEDDFINADGKVEGTGRSNPLAQKWADNFNENYDALCRAYPVFGDLRNLMDLCVVAALIEKHDLTTTAKLDIPLLSGKTDRVPKLNWHAPKTISTQCSFMKSGREWIITASGGVQVESWEAAERTEVIAEVADIRTRAIPTADKQWWWQ